MVLAISIAAILLAGAGAYLLWRVKNNSIAKSDSLPPAPLDGSGRFHAVSIRFGPGACDTSRQLHGRRFLNDAAPRLPLAGCDARSCRCRFVHHRDRRTGSDRRVPFQEGFGGSSTRIDTNRRKRKDRRRTPPDQ